MPTGMRREVLGGAKPRRARALSALALAAAVGALGPRAAHANDWTSLGLTSTRERLSSELGGPTFGAGRWQYEVPATDIATYRHLVSSPAVGDGVVVFGTADGWVRGLRAKTGEQLWTFRAVDGVRASPAIHEGRVFVPSFEGKVYALRLADGRPVWSTMVGGAQHSSPVVVDDTLIVAAGMPERRVVRLDTATGEILWSVGGDVLGEFSNASPAVGGGIVVVGANRGLYYGLDLATGALRWTAEAPGLVSTSSPLISGGRVYLLPGGESDRLYALDLATGQAVSGWPLRLAPPAADVRGTVLKTTAAVSSPVGDGARVVVQIRYDQEIDSSGDFIVDGRLLRELVIAVDPATVQVVWSKANGRLFTADREQVPGFFMVPTPALYRLPGGLAIATASSLSPEVRVLDAAGAELWSSSISGGTRGSPVFANGQLIVGTDAGLMHGLLSDANQPPATPSGFPPADRAVPNVQPTVHWAAAIDPQDEAVSYQVRLDGDGEILESWLSEVTVAAGQTSARLPVTLIPGRSYGYAVRARDGHGAWSEWSPVQSLRAVETPPVSVGGVMLPGGLAEAFTNLVPGDVVTLGAGTFVLTETLRVPPGVTLAGAGPGQTVLSGQGLDVAVLIEGSRAPVITVLKSVTVTGAATGVQVSTSDDALVQNVVVRDCREVGVDVTASGAARVVNATVVRNGTGVRAWGATTVRSSIVTQNVRGLFAGAAGLLTSRYSDVVENSAADREGLEPGEGDIAAEVEFKAPGVDDFRLDVAQATTDRGDPADDFSQEPAPNGGRINMGAFGNTPEAELSTQEPPPGPDGGVITPDAGATGREAGAAPADAGLPVGPDAEGSGGGGGGGGGAWGCQIGGGASGAGGALIVLAAWVVLLRRRRR